MKKVKLIIAAVAMLGLVSSSAVYADGFAPGEGLYIGAFAGVETGLVQPKVTTNGAIAGATNDNLHEGGTWEINDGGLGLQGIVGGGWIGYGYKMGDLYAGLEGEMSAGDVEFKVSGTEVELGCGAGCASTASATEDNTLTSVAAKKEWTGGMFGRLGYYLNPNTLLALKGGILVSKFEVTLVGTDNNLSEDFYGGGPSFGASIESTLVAIDPNLSLRMGTVYTDYLTANVYGIGGNDPTNAANRSGHNSEVTGSALSARIGLTYSFFDVNSLF